MINLSRKIFYRGQLAHNNNQDVKFYTNGSVNHGIKIKQSHNDDFVCNSSDTKKLLIKNEGIYMITLIDGFKSSTDSYIFIKTDKKDFNITGNIEKKLLNTSGNWHTFDYTIQLYIKEKTKLSFNVNKNSTILDGLGYSYITIMKID